MRTTVIMSLFLFLFSLGNPLTASEPEILWVSLERLFTYKDIDRFCSTNESPTSIFFAAELLNGKIQAATFKTDEYFEVYAERLPLTTSEMAAVKIGTDSQGRKWIEHIELNARQLNWLFTRGGGGWDSCVPTQPLVTLGPNEFKYSFNLSDISVKPQISSNIGRFSGKRKDGRLYQATFMLSQKLIP